MKDLHLEFGHPFITGYKGDVNFVYTAKIEGTYFLPKLLFDQVDCNKLNEISIKFNEKMFFEICSNSEEIDIFKELKNNRLFFKWGKDEDEDGDLESDYDRFQDETFYKELSLNIYEMILKNKKLVNNYLKYYNAGEIKPKKDEDNDEVIE